MTQAIHFPKKPATLSIPSCSQPIGRSFVLGRPDQQGSFHIFVSSRLWSIEPGDYSAGDRVHIVSASDGKLIVQSAPVGEYAA